MVRQRPLLVVTSPNTCRSRKKRPMRSKQQDNFLLCVGREIWCEYQTLAHAEWSSAAAAAAHSFLTAGWTSEWRFHRPRFTVDERKSQVCAPQLTVYELFVDGGVGGGLACKPVAPKASPAVLSSHTKAGVLLRGLRSFVTSKLTVHSR